MVEIKLIRGYLNEDQQQLVTVGFESHTEENLFPKYKKERINWIAYDDPDTIIGVLTADVLWDWIYLDELWVDKKYHNRGIGKKLMGEAEEYGVSQGMTGLWLWTQD